MGRWHLLTGPACQRHKVGAGAVMQAACCYWEFESSCQNQDAQRYLIGPACQSPNVATGMNHRPIATMNLKHRAPLSRCLFEYATGGGYKCQSAVHSL
jgi:hypothetical protein